MHKAHSTPYYPLMKNKKIAAWVTLCAMGLASVLAGCDQQVSTDKTSSVSSDGTVKSKEKSVTQSSDGTVTKTEESTKTTPPEKP